MMSGNIIVPRNRDQHRLSTQEILVYHNDYEVRVFLLVPSILKTAQRLNVMCIMHYTCIIVLRVVGILYMVSAYSQYWQHNCVVIMNNE